MKMNEFNCYGPCATCELTKNSTPEEVGCGVVFVGFSENPEMEFTGKPKHLPYKAEVYCMSCMNEEDHGKHEAIGEQVIPYGRALKLMEIGGDSPNHAIGTTLSFLMERGFRIRNRKMLENYIMQDTGNVDDRLRYHLGKATPIEDVIADLEARFPAPLISDAIAMYYSAKGFSTITQVYNYLIHTTPGYRAA